MNYQALIKFISKAAAELHTDQRLFIITIVSHATAVFREKIWKTALNYGQQIERKINLNTITINMNEVQVDVFTQFFTIRCHRKKIAL